MIPIGYVKRTDDDGITEIEVLPEFSEGLYRIGSHKELDILFNFHLSEGYDLKVHPQGDVNRPLMSVFATRSPRRPNPIGLTRVDLISRKGRSIYVKNFDGVVGTPIIDIKGAMGKGFRWDKVTETG